MTWPPSRLPLERNELAILDDEEGDRRLAAGVVALLVERDAPDRAGQVGRRDRVAKLAEVDLQRGATLKIDLGKLRDAIAASDLTGAIGRIAFDEKGDNAGGETPVSFFIVKDGQFVPFEG